MSLSRFLSLAVAVAFATPAFGQFPPPGGPFGPGGPPRFRLPPREVARDRPERLKVDLAAPPTGLVKNPRFMIQGSDKNTPADYTLSGNATWVWCGNEHDFTDAGVAFDSGPNSKKGGNRSGSVSQRVTGFQGGFGRWFRFTIRGLAEPNFSVVNDQLYMHVDYFGNKGANALDSVTQYIYQWVEHDRKALARNGDFFKNGGSAWRTYAFEFRLPFADIDTMDLSVGFRHGNAATNKNAAFYVTEFALEPIAAPPDAPKIAKPSEVPASAADLKSLVSLGGQWYYKLEKPGTKRPTTLIVTAKNADRLFYWDGRRSNPFAENMTAWLRPGFLDLKGNRVEKDQFVPDNVVLEFVDGKDLLVHTRNLPNHPTAKFPDSGGLRNPNSIQEMDHTYYLPLEPVRDPHAVAMNRTNSNVALPGGPIAFAINGVSFYNPFDAEGMEAVNIMDRCCGHPSPDNRYHYHKYPVCVKTPFVDFGDDYSPVIGFALDGFPIYGPYVAKGLMAKDDKKHPLDAFNMRYDPERGWHYHVTPGKFPYVIGGFAGTVDPRNHVGGRPDANRF
jgi:hypothetical protein